MILFEFMSRLAAIVLGVVPSLDKVFSTAVTIAALFVCIFETADASFCRSVISVSTSFVI